MENNNFIPRNLLYVKHIHYKYNLTAWLNKLAFIYDTLYENIIFHQLIRIQYIVPTYIAEIKVHLFFTGNARFLSH